MAMQLGAVRDAFIDAGASPEKAAKASEELAIYQDKFTGVELKLERLDGRVTNLQWMLATVIAGVVAILLKLFIH